MNSVKPVALVSGLGQPSTPYQASMICLIQHKLLPMCNPQHSSQFQIKGEKGVIILSGLTYLV